MYIWVCQRIKPTEGADFNAVWGCLRFYWKSAIKFVSLTACREHNTLRPVWKYANVTRHGVNHRIIYISVMVFFAREFRTDTECETRKTKLETRQRRTFRIRNSRIVRIVRSLCVHKRYYCWLKIELKSVEIRIIRRTMKANTRTQN